MRLRTKVVGILLIGFSLLFALMATISLISLKRNQEENLHAFTNEFSEVSLELLDNNADLFFKQVDTSLADGRINKKEDVSSFINKIVSESHNVMVFDLHDRAVLYGRNGAGEDIGYYQKTIDKAFENWILGKGRTYEYDNFREFIDGDTELVPTKIHFKAYEGIGVMIAYGKAFHAGKARLKYLKVRNEKLYQRGLIFTLLAFILSLMLISTLLIIIIKKLFLSPISKIHEGLRQIKKGDLSLHLDIATRDEFGDLSEFFNETVQELKKSRREMVQRYHNRNLNALGQMAGSVAHDFKNMLQVITSATYLLKQGGSDEAAKKQYLEMITRSSRNASELIQKLLDFGRQNSSGALELVDVHMILDDATGMLARIANKNVEITATKTAESPIVHGDRSQLLNAIVNMGINASHAMPNGGELKITTSNVDFDREYCEKSSFDLIPGRYLRIELADTGCGIPKQDMNRIFEPFYTTREDGKGTGLGLASVYSFVLGHRGAISVSSQVNCGTTFFIDLPLSRSEEKGSYQDESAAGTPDAPNILLISDEYASRKITSDILTSLGYRVMIADTTWAAMELIGKEGNRIDLVQIDMALPLRDIRSTFDQIREISPKIRVVVASEDADEDELSAMFNKGLTGYIPKPLAKRELRRKIEDVLQEWI